jgi:enterobactin synthetase component D
MGWSGVMLQKGVDILPASVAQASACEALADAESAIARVELPPGLGSATAARQLEYRLGRVCAGAAIATLDSALPAFAVPMGADGAPSWPEGLVGSITHTAGFFWAAAGRVSEISALGIDAETIINRPRAARVIRRIVRRREIAALQDALADDGCVALTLAFSAKEAFFKAARPRIHRGFDWLDAHVGLTSRQNDTGTFTVEVRRSVCPELPEGTTFDGRFRIDSVRAYTAVCAAHA